MIHSYRRPDPAKLHWIFKEELASLDRLSEEVRMMGMEKITTDVDLFEYKHKVEDKIQAITDERTDLRKHSRRKISANELEVESPSIYGSRIDSFPRHIRERRLSAGASASQRSLPDIRSFYRRRKRASVIVLA